jgi:hypothetical protein
MNGYGFEDAAWEEAKEEARQILITIAKRRDKIAYSELMPQVTKIALPYDDLRVAHFLGEISESEDDAGRGLLTAIVVHKTGDMQPGPGFFELAKRRGRNTRDRTKCWVKEYERVYNIWATPQ